MSEEFQDEFEKLSKRDKKKVMKAKTKVMNDIKKITTINDFLDFLVKYMDKLVIKHPKNPDKDTLLINKSGRAFLASYNKMILEGRCFVKTSHKFVTEVKLL